MSAQHHGPFNEKKIDIMQRFIDQANGSARREFSAGRIGPDDDGFLALAIAADVKHQTIVIRFGKPVEWIGLGIKEAEYLRDSLTDRLFELRGIKPG